MEINNLIVSAAACLGLPAQSSGERITARVPFAFEMNGMAMPAGTYELHYDSDRPYALARHSDSGQGFLIQVPRTSRVRISKSALVFEFHASGYVLTAVADKATGGAIRMPRATAVTDMAYADTTVIHMTAAA